MDFKVLIDLLSFNQSQVIESEDIDGNIVKGVFIPLKYNDLKLNNKGRIYAKFAGFMKESAYKGIIYDLFFMWSKDFTDRFNFTSDKNSFVGFISLLKNRKKYYICSRKVNNSEFKSIEEDGEI